MIDFKTLVNVLKLVAQDRKPSLVRGAHGIGKSEVVYSFAKDMNLPVVERRASQMTEGDLLGLPVISGNSTKWNPPDWFKQACDMPVCLFLDEVDRATPEVRQGIFELNDSRKMAGYNLHPDTIVIAACNGGEHGAEYKVGDMDPAELDRYVVFDVEPTVEDWLSWAAKKEDGNPRICSLLWDFINRHRAHWQHTGNFESGKVYPSPRSWTRLNDILVRNNLHSVQPGQNGIVLKLAQAYVGVEAAIAFIDFANNYQFEVTVEDVLDNGRLDLVKDFTLNKHLALVEKISKSGYFDNVLTDKQYLNYLNYFIQLPSEAVMPLFKVITNSSDSETSNPNLEAHIRKIQHMKSTVPSVLTGKKIESIGLYIAMIVTGKTEEELMRESEENNPEEEAPKTTSKNKKIK